VPLHLVSHLIYLESRDHASGRRFSTWHSHRIEPTHCACKCCILAAVGTLEKEKKEEIGHRSYFELLYISWFQLSRSTKLGISCPLRESEDK
jgi:hypothetical protein